MGRPNEYIRRVEPHLEEVTEMALYMTEKQIANTLGVSESQWYTYKKKYPELCTALKKGRRTLVKELKSVLIEKAKGFTYQESRKVIEGGKVIREEITTKRALPDLGSIHLLLKNYDPDGWAEDPNLLKIKREELELKKQTAEWK